MKTMLLNVSTPARKCRNVTLGCAQPRSPVSHLFLTLTLLVVVEFRFCLPTHSATITYQYDPVNRLTNTEYSDGSRESYLYDAAGNRLSRVTHSANTIVAPDLAPIGFGPLVVPASPFSISFTIVNQGNGAAAGVFFDSVYISSNAMLNAGSQYLGGHERIGARGGCEHDANHLRGPARLGEERRIFHRRRKFEGYLVRAGEN